jgi:hypothetical protein
MKKMLLVAVALALFSDQVDSQALNELINKNVRNATAAYEKTLQSAQQSASPAQLWIHVRSDSQKKLAQEIQDRLNSTEVAHGKIEQKPVEKVDAGPEKSQLRYFKKRDQAQAQELFEFLRKQVPQLTISDLSAKYDSVGWIASGHYELWLAPDLVRLQPQR